jgi:hypothetical protein
MATQATLAGLAKLTGMRDGVLARTARKDFADDPARFKHSASPSTIFCSTFKQRIGRFTARRRARKGASSKPSVRRCSPARKYHREARRLHAALRNFSGKPVQVDEGRDAQVIDTRKDAELAADVREGRVRGALGQP